MAVSKIPEGYHSLTPYLTMKDGNRAIEFYKKALGAKEVMRMPGPGGSIAHADLLIGDSHIMMSDEMPERGALSPKTLGGVSGSLMLYLDNVDEAFAKAVAAGGKVIQPVQDQFYGDRSGTFEDPDGHKWTIGTHIEDVSNEEMERRMADMFKPA